MRPPGSEEVLINSFPSYHTTGVAWSIFCAPSRLGTNANHAIRRESCQQAASAARIPAPEHRVNATGRRPGAASTGAIHGQKANRRLGALTKTMVDTMPIAPRAKGATKLRKRRLHQNRTLISSRLAASLRHTKAASVRAGSAEACKRGISIRSSAMAAMPETRRVSELSAINADAATHFAPRGGRAFCPAGKAGAHGRE